jgi:RHS repeat-associated protein
LRVPPASNGPTPQLGISYDSGSVDGRTAATNNQPSWMGEGFDLGVGYVERRYVSCLDDMGGTNINTVKTGDLCWKTDNAVLSLAGHSSELVKDDTTGAWKLLNDDGSRMEHLTGATNSPDNDGEYWKLTTSDGTQYFFGKTLRYAGDPVTDSGATWTVPVAGNQTGEPCRASTFKASFCTQAWRWNVDYVVDPYGNTMSYSYARETNRYQQLAPVSADAASVAYTRGGYLKKIDYGQRAGSEVATAPAKVVFTTAERCTVTSSFDCAAAKLTSANAAKWPDVPFDQICTSTSTCGTNGAPTFFTRKKLTSVSTQVLEADNTFSTVDQWDFAQDFYSPVDSDSGGLELKGITHTGKSGGTATMPAITFTYELFRNRVTGLLDGPTMFKPRLTSVWNETGGQISAHYDTASSALCTSSSLPSSVATNTTRCFPSYWSPEGATTPTLTYFYKYVVGQISEGDEVGGALDTVTSITYVGGAAWKYDDNELTPAKLRTWSDWRGYGTVEERMGDGSTPKTLTRTIFLRGMNGNRAADGSSVSVSVADTKGGSTVDAERLNGTPLDTTVWNGSSLVSTSITKPWVSAATATSGSKKATILGPGTTTEYTVLSGGGEQQTRTTTTTDGTYATTTQVDDEGDVSTTADDHCTRYTYVRNTTAWITGAASRQQDASLKCASTPATADIVGDTRTLYDGAAFGATPSKGLVTETQALKTAGGSDYAMRSKATYDARGRVLTSSDAMGHTTSTAYTQLAITGQTYTGGVTKVTTTDPKKFVASSDVNPAWGTPVTETDINGQITSLAYDGLGRLTGVWLPTRAKATYPTYPSMRFAYSITKTAPSVVTSEEILNTATDVPSYISRYEIFDGLLRPRQTQNPEASTNGGRVIADTEYDSRGLPIRQNGPYYSTGAPNGTLVAITDVQKAVSHELTYDQAARVVKDRFMSIGVEKGTTLTTYGGNFVTIDPPDGAQPSTTFSDATGRATIVRRYHANSPDASKGYDDTTYSYYPSGEIKQVTGPSGAKWDYIYDLRGRLTAANDPDKGASALTYNENDQVVTSTDSRGKTIWTGYDELGRVTATRQNNETGTLLTSRTYDTVAGGKGKAATSVRYVNGNAFTDAITGYDAAYRPTAGSVTIPASEGALAGTYASTNKYSSNGSLTVATLPAVPGMATETVQYTYDSRVGAPNAMAATGIGSLVGGVTRSPYGEGLIYGMGQAGSPAIWLGQAFEDGTRRLVAQTAQRENQGGAYDVNLNYTYDKGGNLTSGVDNPGVANAPAEAQCYKYDYAAQLTDAWTPTNNSCEADPTPDTLGGPAGYWHSYTYDAAGNRKQETYHSSWGDTSRAYTYPAVTASGKGQPHTLTKMVSTPLVGSATTRDYKYDPTGNMESVAKSGATVGSQTMTWDDEGHLESAVSDGMKSSAVYDADGERLIRREGTKNTLYLDNTEVQVDTATGVVNSTRYYAFDGQTVAMRQSSGGGVRVLLSDQSGSAIWSVDTATATDAQRRRFTPFGADRVGFTSVVWAGERGFVDGQKDIATGYTHLGAREYDPSTGRFLSVDPVMDAGDPASLNPYAYARNSPVTLSDPSGLCPIEINTCFDGGTKEENKKHRAGYGNKLNKNREHRDRASGSSDGVNNPAMQQATARLNAARSNSLEIKKRLVEAAKMLGKIAMDELGITAGLDCFTKGDIGACAETALTALSSVVGGLAGKIITKYAWRWGKAAKLAKTLYKLGSDLAAGVQGMFKAKREGELAERGFEEALAGASCALSFSPDTPVLMADGTKKLIKDIVVGDKVLATDTKTGKNTKRAVTTLFINHDTDLLNLVVKTAHGTATIKTTEGHPFWDQTTHTWTRAADLTMKARLRMPDGREVALVSAAAPMLTNGFMWDLTVDIDHDFYVAAGTESVLVHNCKGPVTLSDDQIDTHVLPRHGAGTPADGSKFDESVDPDDLEKMANEVVSGNPNVIREDAVTGNHTHEGNLGRKIGEKGETRARVWVSDTGEVQTIHPIR